MTDAFFRRLIIINFTHQFFGDKDDPHIIDKICTEEEFTILLNELLARLPRVIREGVRKVSDITLETNYNQFMRSANSVAAFVKEGLERDVAGKVLLKLDLYNWYLKYCSTQYVDEAERLVNYDESALTKLAGDKRLGAERIQGKTEDFVGVAFLELARTAASTVGRVVTEDFQAIGSGFMISDRLFLTNNHVIPDIQEGQQCIVEFNYEMSVNRQPKPISRFALRPDEFFVTNNEDDLDFTIIAVGESVDGKGKLSDFGYCPLIGSDDKHVLGEFVNIIQHPEGDMNSSLTLKIYL